MTTCLDQQISNMIFQSFHQGGGEGNVDETQHSFIGEESRASPADPHPFIGEENRASSADTNQDDKVEHFALEAFLAQQRFEMRTQEMLKIIAEHAAEQLRQQEQSYRAEAQQ